MGQVVEEAPKPVSGYRLTGAKLSKKAHTHTRTTHARTAHTI